MLGSSSVTLITIILSQTLNHAVKAAPAPGIAALANWYNDNFAVIPRDLHDRSRMLCMPGVTDGFCDDKCEAHGFYEGVCGPK